jgi:hypothetical protein
MFEHYLITRFNLRNPKWTVTKNNELLLTKEWMDERFELFANFCLPSVVAQTQKNFKWLIYFDSGTAEEHRQQISSLINSHPFIEIFYIDGMPNLIPSIKSYLSEYSKSEYLITSRIDNDDCISINFIDQVQQQFEKQDYFAIDFTSGYTLNMDPIMIGKKEHIFNPFISLIEMNKNPKTVWTNDHNQWKKETSLIHISNNRVWMSVIHTKNKVNEFDGYGNVNWIQLSNEFKVSLSIHNKISNEMVPYTKWWFLSMKNYLYVKMVFFSKTTKKKLGLYKIKG